MNLARFIYASLSLLPVVAGAVVPEFQEGFRTIVERYCLECHDEKKQKGGVDLSVVTNGETALDRYHLLRKVAEQVRSGEMPPEDEQALKPEDKQTLLHWIAGTFDTSKSPHPGPPLARQLTRAEYNATLRDLLRINFDAASQAGIPEENVVGGYSNRAGGLVLEPVLMEKFFTAADLALDYLFGDKAAAGPLKTLLVVRPDDSTQPDSALRKVLSVFLPRAFRRPVADEEVNAFARLGVSALTNGDAFEEAVRKAIKPVLVSPHFLLRLESTASATPGTVARVSNAELAVRLSYFLWATMPDEELFIAANNGTLSEPEGFERQVRRMLAHQKAEALNRYFLERWLQLPSIQKALPSQNAFPSYTRSLRDAMERETRMFCEHLRKEDRSILEFIEADYTFVNAELSKHYRIIPPSGKDIAKVNLRPEDHRGGLLGMGSILTMTSHTDRTKPTARGKWILEVLLGTPPPPPPPNAGTFAPKSKDKIEPKSFREKLAQHASNASCVGCHRRVDPLGFALEDFDAVGTWRADAGGQTVDNAGTLPGIGDFKGVEGLRRILQQKQPVIIRNIAAQTLSYALGRDLSYYDEPALDEIVTALAQNEHRFSSLILGVAKSYPFQNRKAE